MFTDTEKSISLDSLFGGDLICRQSASGYRFSVDSVLLAHFVDIRTNDRLLDLGTGCGIIMLILIYRWGSKIKEVIGIEIQEKLADLAIINLKTNAFDKKGKVVTADIKDIIQHVPPESFDTVVCNPPFFPPLSGKLNDNIEACLARHQILGTLDDFLAAAALSVRNKGSIYFIYPAEQIVSFIEIARRHRLEIKRMQFLYSYPENAQVARLVLLHCKKNGGLGARILSPFYIYETLNGSFSPEMQRCYEKQHPLFLG